MIRRPAALAFAFALLALPATGQEQPKAAASADQALPKAVIELFTSQGCASCPPADALLSDLAKEPGIIALTLAVDYWDYIGWKDTLALHGHGVRQRSYAEQRADRKIYTPQIIVDGVISAKGSDRRAIEKAMDRARSAGNLVVPVAARRDGEDLVIDLPAYEGAHDGAEIWACPLMREQNVSIGRGENTGRSVVYTNVVRGWVRLGPWAGEPRTLRVPVEHLRREGTDAVAILVQRGAPGVPGPIVGARLLPLD